MTVKRYRWSHDQRDHVDEHGYGCSAIEIVGADDYDALAARLADAERTNAELNVEVSRLYACRNELQDVTQAMDDPSVNNARSLKDAIHAMKSRLADAERDAARYRWLRETSYNSPPKVDPCEPYLVQTETSPRDWRGDLDAAIDAALEVPK